MTRAIVFGAAAVVLFALGIIAANTRIAQGIIPVTAYEADVNKSGAVTGSDVALVKSKFGQVAPTATPTPTSYCNLSGRTFPTGPESELYDPQEARGRLEYADFSGCLLVGTQFGGSSPHYLEVDLTGASFRSADLSGAILDGADLKNADFVGANLTGARLGDIAGVTVDGADASGASFRDANLSLAILDGEFPNASFRGANLTNATLVGEGRGADFTDATTSGTDVQGVVWGNTTCPNGTNSDNNNGTCIGQGFEGTDTCSGAEVNVRWVAGNGHCFQRFGSTLTWYEAQVDCASREGYLATLTSVSENAFVWSNAGVPGAFIGLNDAAQESVWKWVSEENTEYTNWHAGEPNNGDGGPVEHAAAFHGAFADGTWNDITNDTSNPAAYICETE